MSRREVIGIGLMLMSFSSGGIDILSYRFLGEVFPSAMTGNVALMGLSLGQGDVTAAVRNACAFGGFFAGLLIGAGVLRDAPGRWRFVLALTVQCAALCGFLLLWNRSGTPPWRYGLIGLAAVAMGLQSAVAHRIGLTGVTTTYFTGTLTNIAFGLVAPSAPSPVGNAVARRLGWPALAFLSYLAGAVMGGWYSAGRNLPELPVGLPALPLVATVVLALMMAAGAGERPAPLPVRRP